MMPLVQATARKHQGPQVVLLLLLCRPSLPYLPVGVDSSLSAVSLAKENARLSSENAHATFVAGAVEGFMQDAASSGQRWDIVVLGEKHLLMSLLMPASNAPVSSTAANL